MNRHLSIPDDLARRFPPIADSTRRCSARDLHEFLQVDGVCRTGVALSYDGDRTVVVGPVRVHYAAHAVEITFADPYRVIDTPVVVYLPGVGMFSAVVTIVSGLLAELAVTR
jgi:hypothetical protein